MSREQLLALLFIGAPVPLLLIVAVLRGYTITIHFRRNRGGKDDE